MKEHYKKIREVSRSIETAYIRLSKCTSSYDRATSLLDIEKKKHELHCLCVECWVACYEEYRYWEKKRSLDDFHEQLVLFRKPNIIQLCIQKY